MTVPVGTPVPIQLCLQGGAAKIALLTAFMEAVEELHGEVIRVTNVAGTSAGAIVGALFAAGVPMATVRERLRRAPLAKIVPHRGDLLTKLALARGEPLWNEAEFRKFLQSLFGESLLLNNLPRGEKPKELTSFADILKHRGIRTQVMATNLTDTASEPRKDGDSIVSSLLDSAAVPFFFRAHNSKNGTIVDGGLCENLPVELLQDSEEDGPIVGVSFVRKAGDPPSNLGEYCLAVVSAGIDHSVDRAKQMLEDRAKRSGLPHEVFAISSPIESFDFEKAIREGLGDPYNDVLNGARLWLKNYVDARSRQLKAARKATERTQAEKSVQLGLTEYYQRVMPRNLATMYKTQHEPIKLRWSYAKLEVKVSPDHGIPDTLNHSAEFHTGDQPVWCHRLPILVAQASTLTESKWKIFGPQNEEIPYYHMLMDEDGKPETLERLVCFETPLPPKSGPYTLVLSDSVRDFMRLLKDGEKDDLWVSFHRRAGSVDMVEVIAYVPETIPAMDLEPMAGARASAAIDRLELDLHRPDGHKPYGLRGFDVSADRWGMYFKPQ